MVRIWIIGITLMLLIAIPALAQQRRAPAPEVLGRLHSLCEQDYKPACIKLGLVIGSLPPLAVRKLRREHPEWWWWERW